jgi:hypothetical protein
LFEFDVPLLIKNNFISFSDSDEGKAALVQAESTRASTSSYKSPW